MDTFTVHIETKNDVFDGNLSFAVAGLLHTLADHIEAGNWPQFMRDANGNTVLETFKDIDANECCRIGGFSVE